MLLYQTSSKFGVLFAKNIVTRQKDNAGKFFHGSFFIVFRYWNFAIETYQQTTKNFKLDRILHWNAMVEKKEEKYGILIFPTHQNFFSP